MTYRQGQDVCRPERKVAKAESHASISRQSDDEFARMPGNAPEGPAMLYQPATLVNSGHIEFPAFFANLTSRQHLPTILRDTVSTAGIPE